MAAVDAHQYEPTGQYEAYQMQQQYEAHQQQQQYEAHAQHQEYAPQHQPSYDDDGLLVKVETMNLGVPQGDAAQYAPNGQPYVRQAAPPPPPAMSQQNKQQWIPQNGGLSAQPSMTPSEMDSERSFAMTERSFLRSASFTIHPPVDEARAHADIAALCAILAPNSTVAASREQQLQFLARFVESYDAFTHAPNINAAFGGDANKMAYRAIGLRLAAAEKESDPEFMRTLLSVLRVLTRSDDANTEMAKCNVPRLLAKALVKCMDDPAAVYHGSSAIGNMARTPLSQQALKANDAWPAVLKALQMHKGDIGVVRGAMLGLEKLTNEFPKKLGKDTVQEVLSVMQQYINDAQIQASGCGALWKYSIGSFILNNNKKFLGDMVAVPAVLSAINVHPTDPRVVWKGLGALNSFASHALNRAIYRHYEGDKYVTQAMEMCSDVKDIQTIGRRLLDRISKSAPPPEGAGIDWKILPNAIIAPQYITGTRDRMYPAPKGAAPPPPAAVAL
eukprot:tig00020557_g11117.t1